jgi:hypothetical protein
MIPPFHVGVVPFRQKQFFYNTGIKNNPELLKSEKGRLSETS